MSDEAYLIIEKAYESNNLDQVIKFSQARTKNVPDDPYGPYWLGMGLLAQDRVREAIIAFKQALKKDEAHYASLAGLAFSKLRLCDWTDLDDIKSRLFEATDESFENGEFRYIDPFMTLALSPTPEFQQKVAQARANYIYKTRPTYKWKGYPEKTGKLKIGYLSPDFNNNAAGLLIRGLFAFHDREKFEIYGLSLKSAEGEIRQRIEESCDTFMDFTGIADFEIAKRIHNEGIHILVDLTGYNKRSRPRIMAMKPTPVQCHYLGYPSTLGADYVGHHITSPLAVTEDMKPFFTETIHYLDEVGFATAPFSMPESTISRSDVGLPDDVFVYASFCQAYRVDEEVFKTWMDILNSTDNSILWLLAGPPEIEDNLRHYADSCGVDPERLIFAESEQMTARWRHQLADVWLDPFTISSRTTAILSMWSGLPVITKLGDVPQSRIAACYNVGAGMDELNTSSAEEYKNLAIELYDDQEKLANIKESMIQNRLESPLFHPAEHIKQLETAYEAMWDSYKK